MRPSIRTVLVVLALVVLCVLNTDGVGNTNITQAKAFLKQYDTDYGKAMNAEAFAEWSYNTDISKNTMAHLVRIAV